MSSRIENYLGFPMGLSGGDLARRAVVQAQRFGAEILAPQEAVGVRTEGSYRFIKLADGNEISCHALMIATGVQWRRLVLPKRIDAWSLTSLQQRLVKAGGRLVKHARYYWLLLAEGHLHRRLFGQMLRRIWALPVPSG
jgi:hypothetical protein